jgi:hypothetical protein
MKLQSNKNTIVISSIAFCLACLSFCAPTFASYSSLEEESFLPSTNVSTNGDGEKSLADFGEVLWQRLAGVWQEVRGLVDGRQVEQSASSFSLSSTNANSHAVDVATLFSSGVHVDNYFSDTSGHTHASYINLLAKEGIVAWQWGKFYPDNYLRSYDLVKMIVDLYRLKVGYSLDGEAWLSLVGISSGDDSLPSRYLATAYHLGFLAHTKPLDFQTFVDSQDFMQILVNISYQFSGMLRPLEIDNDTVITRWEAAEYLVMSFDITTDGMLPYASGTQMIQTPFVDIFAHPYQSAISTLAGLGIVSIDSPKFYPDNYLHRYDFIIMMVNAVLNSQGKTLSAEYVSGFDSPFVDVSAASYSPFVYFAYDRGLLGFLTVNKRWQDYLLPDTLMTRHEVYTILGQATKTAFTYTIATADAQYMTRWEFAQILVDLFDFTLPELEEIAPSADVQTWGLLDKLSTLLQIKELFAKL